MITVGLVAVRPIPSPSLAAAGFAKVVERLRVQAARAMNLAPRHSLDTIATGKGLAELECTGHALLRVPDRTPPDLGGTARQRTAA